MKYAWIQQHRNTWPVHIMCAVLGVNRSGYFAHKQWQNAMECVRKVMQQHSITAKVKPRFVVTPDSNHDLPKADNLLKRCFSPAVPN